MQFLFAKLPANVLGEISAQGVRSEELIKLMRRKIEVPPSPSAMEFEKKLSFSIAVRNRLENT
jgi:hypothetical protein